MHKLALILFVTATLAACSAAPDVAQESRRTDSIDVRSAIQPEFLAAFGEAQLARGASDSAVRVFYIPAFDHPLMIRHSSTGSTGLNRAVVLSGKGGYEPGNICFESSSESNLGQVEARISRLEEAGFWQSPPSDKVGGSDGALYFIEVVRNGTYRGWVRWSPTHNSKERQLESLNTFLLGEIFNEGLVGITCEA